MKLNIISDLHCRSRSFPKSFDPEQLEPADCLVVAGDLGTASTYKAVAEKLVGATFGKFSNYFFVRGNHDFYDVDGDLTRDGKYSGPFDDHNSSIVVGDVAILGSTLWTPVSGKTASDGGVNDYFYIPGFGADSSTCLFERNMDWLSKEAAEHREAGRKVVVVTHHLPREELIDEEYLDSPVNDAFCVMGDAGYRLTDAVKADLWIHGHSHRFMDKTVGDTRYVRNPYGYEWSKFGSKEETGFRMNFIVEV